MLQEKCARAILQYISNLDGCFETQNSTAAAAANSQCARGPIFFYIFVSHLWRSDEGEEPPWRSLLQTDPHDYEPDDDYMKERRRRRWRKILYSQRDDMKRTWESRYGQKMRRNCRSDCTQSAGLWRELRERRRRPSSFFFPRRLTNNHSFALPRLLLLLRAVS